MREALRRERFATRRFVQWSELGLSLVLLVIVGGGCATRGFVRNEVEQVRSDLVARTDAAIAEVRNSAQQAEERADLALGQSEGARQLALGRVGYREVSQSSVQFGFDKDELEEDAFATLDGVASEIQARPEVIVDIYGFTDSRGPDRYNYQLGQRRADAVLRHLADRLPGQLHRFAAISYGESRAAYDGSDAGSQRRVVVSLVERVPLDGDTPPPAEDAGQEEPRELSGGTPAGDMSSEDLEEQPYLESNGGGQ